MTPLRFRQVHLDFHTSPDIPAIGADFDPDEFAQTLVNAHVDSITCFARCHHGMIYFDSKRHPERVHPQLARKNLLVEQIEACHKRGIRVPIYVTVQWDQWTADNHREWLCIDEKGTEVGTSPLNPGFYRVLDVFHTGYRQFLFDHVREILDTMPVDGFFFDIVQSRPSLAIHWKQGMDTAGLNPELPEHRQQFAQTVIYQWERDMTDFIRQTKSDCTIFYNSGHVGPRHRANISAYTHWELESLPSGGWGYLHFPQAMRFGRTLGLDALGMTGKFHTSWGDFGSYKNQAALEFECFHMLALGAKCSIGDQLPPQGKLDEATYKLIGAVYGQVAAKQPYCVGAVAVNEVAVLTGEAFNGTMASNDISPWQAERHQPSVLGAIRMLQELRIQFDIVDGVADYNRYKLLVLPDNIPVDGELAAKIEVYLAQGGKLIASHRSGLRPDGGDFALPQMGVRFVGDAPFSPDFLAPKADGDLARWLPNDEYVMYMKGTQVAPVGDVTIVAQTHAPYFNRTWRHFCSHRHTPSSHTDAGYPSVVQGDGCIYLAHPVFAQYQDCAPRWCKTIVEYALQTLMGAPIITVENAPTGLLTALNRQEAESRYILHLLFYIPERRGTQFDVIEDVIPLHDVAVRVQIPQSVQSLQIVPSGAELPFAWENDVLTFTLPKLEGHAMIEIRTA